LHPAKHTSSKAHSGSSAVANLHPRRALNERNFRGRERKIKSSGSFLDFSSLDATRAYAHRFRVAARRRAHALQVGVPAPAARIVGVAHHVSVLGALAAEFTLHCHKLFLYH
jgi:hypothetical protein